MKIKNNYDGFIICSAEKSDTIQLFQLLKRCVLECELDEELVCFDLDQFINHLGFGSCKKDDQVLHCVLAKKTSDNTIIGLITYSYAYYSYTGKELYLNHLYVLPEFRSLGLGKLLLSELAKIASEQSIQIIKYDVADSNVNFRRFMATAGVRILTEETGYCLYKFDLNRLINS